MLRCKPTQNTHPPQAGSVFESAYVLPSNMIWGFETSSNNYWKDKSNAGDTQVVQDGKEGGFSIAEGWGFLRSGKLKKAKPKFGLAFFNCGSLNAVVLVRGHSPC